MDANHVNCWQTFGLRDSQEEDPQKEDPQNTWSSWDGTWA